MKAILLAAGKGTRISRNIKNVPKSTLPINGESLIKINVKRFLNMGFDVSVVVGYQHEIIKKELEGLKVNYYYNPFYAVTNSIGSIWIAREQLTDDCIIMNADVYCEQILIDKLLEVKQDAVMTIDTSRVEIGDYFFGTDENGLIVKYGKDLPLENRTGEYVGIGVIRKSFLNKFKKELNRLIWNGEYNLWWENVLYSLADKGSPVSTIDVKGVFWSEIDYFDDYLRIVEYANNKA